MSRDEVVERLFAVFRQRGYAGASLSELSQATGLGRSSLYHYFPGGKEDMARAALDYLDGWVEGHLLVPLRGAGTPAERLARMMAELDRLYDHGRSACLLGALVHGEGRHLFQERLRSSFCALVAALAALVVESGVAPAEAQRRAEEAMVRIQGSLVLSGGLDDDGPFRRMLAGLGALLLD
jgi:AcrR family transcriptional regulator